ncbi:MAG: leucine-rich repeat domain-containing protein [Treponema sp.]|jgi:uncharacterized protein YjbI with pentapeptide repeats|nr:leucine-rich repeat domain-containing protein [Treponema sp.]
MKNRRLLAALTALCVLCVSGCPNPWLNRMFKSELEAAAGLTGPVWPVLPGTGGTPPEAEPVFTTIAEVEAWLDSLVPPEGTLSDPAPLIVQLDLANTLGEGWADLLAAIGARGKYVDLNLSLSDLNNMTGTPGEFGPGTPSAGMQYITSLTLPPDTASIKAGSFLVSTFKDFTNLKSVGGEGVGGIGSYTFYNCSKLETAYFPEAADIGTNAFQNCYTLTTAYFPEVTGIGNYAFQNCSSLTEAYFPEAAVIGMDAFQSCGNLDTTDFSKVTNIGANAFSGCTSLTGADFPKAEIIGADAFQSCTALATLNLPVAANIGNFALANTGGTPLTVTLGNTPPPALGTGMFNGVVLPKTVTVKVPYPDAPAWEGAGYDSVWANDFTGGNPFVTVTFESSL